MNEQKIIKIGKYAHPTQSATVQVCCTAVGNMKKNQTTDAVYLLENKMTWEM